MKTFFFALILIFLSSAIIPTAYAETEKGKNFDREFLGYTDKNEATYKWSSHPERIIISYEWSGAPIYSDYRLTETPSSVFLETANSGSYHFDKNECSYNFYESGYIGTTTPKVKNISWNVKGKAAASSTWSSLPSINNAVCVVTVETTESTVKLTGQKANSQGTFQIVLDYAPGSGIKETMRGFNNNTAWNNHNIGFTESFDVPQIIRFNGNEFDLSQYNGTILGRTWIQNNNAKLITLSDKVFYDFGIGFENLDNIRILWDGSQASLELNYLFANDVVPYQTWFEVDPTFSSNNPTVDGFLRSSTTVPCATAGAGATKNTAGTQITVATDSGNTCYRGFFEWDISSIPAVIIVTNTVFKFETDSLVAASGQNCDYMPVLQARPSTASISELWNDVGNGTAYVNNDATCATVGTNKSIDLSSSADADVEIQLPGGWFALGIKLDDETTGGDKGENIASEENATPVPAPTLEITYVEGPFADAVTDLTAAEITTVSALLDWTQPALNGATVIGYQINMSAGGGDPQTVVENNTGSTDTEYIATGLTGGVNSFRVGIWTTNTLNASGNTATLTGVSFAIGSINVTESNPDLLGIWFERDDLNDTASFVNVTYPNTYDLACNLSYVYAQINQTYTNLSNVTAPNDRVTSSFLFVDAGNDVVNMRCWDQITNDTGLYVLTQTDFLLLQQILDFRAGEFGTQGFIGVVDVVTVAVVILSMIGFNRLSESVGVIFNAVMIGVLGYFEFITFPGIFFSALGLVIVLAIYTTRKD